MAPVQPAPSGAPLVRPGLCMLAQPCLRQHTLAARYRFFEASLLLVRSGRLSLDIGDRPWCVDGPSNLVAVAQNLCTDVAKTPGDDQTFRSLFLAFAPAVITEFYQRYEPEDHQAAVVDTCQEVPLDADLEATLTHCLSAVEPAPASDRVLRHRLLGLLLALAERGILFARPSERSVVRRLTALLSAAPGDPWTAARASAELAMSEATLRRRLVAEQARFDTLLLEVRMHHAMTLLQTTRWSVLQIAAACGYQAGARFSQRFRARFGCAPSQAR